jgi:hypothetical protein
MKNRMMTTMMKLLMSMVKRMETRKAVIEMGTIVVKVVLLVLQSVATMMQPPLAVGMVDPIIFPRKNEPRKLQTKE